MILLTGDKLTDAFTQDTCLWTCWTNCTFSKHGGNTLKWADLPFHVPVHPQKL